MAAVALGVAETPEILDTPFVGMDEPALQLTELDLPSPGSRGMHRYLSVLLLRGDRVWRWRRDLGPSAHFTRAPFRVIGGGTEHGKFWSVHTVGQLIDIVEAYWAGKLSDDAPPEPRDLITRYHNHTDERRARRRQRSSFGRLVKLQRDS